MERVRRGVRSSSASSASVSQDSRCAARAWGVGWRGVGIYVWSQTLIVFSRGRRRNITLDGM